MGDAAAALVVLVGGGLLGGAVFQVPDFLGPADAAPLFGPGGGGPAAVFPDGTPRPQGHHLTTLILLVFPALLMCVRRRWPIFVFALAYSTFVVAVLLGVPSLGSGIAATIAAYAFAFRIPRRPTLVVMAAAAAAVVMLALAHTEWESLDPRVFQVGAALAIAAALGDSARSRQEFLHQAEDRAQRAEQTREAEAQRRVSEERLRIARDLHDTVAHQISVINLQAGAASGFVTSQPDRALGALSAIREASRGVLSEIGGLLRYLREDGGTGAAAPQLEWEALEALVERMRSAGLDVAIETAGDLSRVSGRTSMTAYRVVQEGLTNAHKHGRGGTARLGIAVAAQRITISVENPVAGDVSSAAPRTSGTGLGLIGLRERVAVLDGTVSTTSERGRYRLRVELPLPEEEVGPS